ncbi:hypothetical protein [Rothia sp. CCM 9419]|uniref:hypothetical protein n=1 Tax=Rothia sp. CCM 9419 TaxID=3402662 RepID=UPI003AD84348
MVTHHSNSSAQLIGVYAADGGIKGELSYVWGKLRHTRSCALCDITHGLNPLGKKEWKTACATLPIPFSAVHLNERDDLLKKIIPDTQAPAIAYIQDGTGFILINAEELEQCHKSAEALVSLISQKLMNIERQS